MVALMTRDEEDAKGYAGPGDGNGCLPIVLLFLLVLIVMVFARRCA